MTTVASALRTWTWRARTWMEAASMYQHHLAKAQFFAPAATAPMQATRVRLAVILPDGVEVSLPADLGGRTTSVVNGREVAGVWVRVSLGLVEQAVLESACAQAALER